MKMKILRTKMKTSSTRMTFSSMGTQAKSEIWLVDSVGLWCSICRVEVLECCPNA